MVGESTNTHTHSRNYDVMKQIIHEPDTEMPDTKETELIIRELTLAE
jgi:hypothetical protein